MTNPTPESESQSLSPKILFQSQLITAAEEESLPFETVELVRKNQPLVQLTDAATTQTARKPILMEKEGHTVVSEDQKSLLAAIDGFPFLSTQKSAEYESISVSIVPLLSIADDGMEASITLYPPVSGCKELTGEELFEILSEQNGICVGLDQQRLNELLLRCRQEQTILSQETVARGFLPLNGKDSFLRFDIDVGPRPGKILGNGKIDFRERKMFVGVKKGQTIATQVPATSGTPGITVLGKEIPQQEGQNIPVTVSDDAEYDGASSIIRALHSGILSLVDDNTIKVCAKQVISGDIDFNTGNIESNDSVEVNGSVQPGFKVHTQGDLLIEGSIRSGLIHCHGNLVVKGGIIGSQGDIRGHGDTDLNFIEKGHIKCGGRVVIRKQAYYSTIMADGDIHCEESSKIIGGMLLSGGSISVGSVGSGNAPPSLLVAGVDPERYLDYIEMRSRLQDQEQVLQLLLQRHGQKVKSSERESLEESIRNLDYDLHKLNLIPGTDPEAPEQGLSYLQGTNIISHGMIFAGTKLQIGKAAKTLPHDLEGIRFFLELDGNSIIEAQL